MKLYISLLAFTTSALSQTVLNPNGNNDKCIDVKDGVFANGTAAQIYDCNHTAAQQWVVRLGSTTIQLANTNFCLDSITATPANGTPMRIWQCISGIATQQWSFTAATTGGRVTLGNQGICLDLRDAGDVTNGNVVQAYKCLGNTYQIWTNGA
ncbi:carbohydrate-binding module family 13 protein [Macrolepiota fuliginosa MF-IS2]|uniref:Carbohydrate-binding module family 13 protein n=1 Tax=Macrolepiota fuliginosa MF-IS2 TaxID=1400762 RepID=A0A9P6C1M4_9AGAR|nr:carbohydrate-binding module family 13 protein [Macrolepiota fuliginosa MF-IS2]